MGIHGSNAINGLNELHNEKDQAREEREMAAAKGYMEMGYINLGMAEEDFHLESQSDYTTNEFLTQND